MLFNSYIFLLVFLPSTYFFYRLCIRFRMLEGSFGVLLLASLIFYYYWNPPFVFLITSSVLFNYFVVRIMLHTAKYQRFLLWGGIACNLTPLLYFKYYGFLLNNLNTLFHTTLNIPSLFLPLGISFFTFQQISYLYDSYRGLTTPPKLLHYAMVVCFFPHLIAGPILRYREILPQLVTARTFCLSWRNIAIGLTLFSLGLCKKVLIADSLSPFVKAVFDNPSFSPNFCMTWLAALAYTFQIYFDFSGYSDMAVGLGKLFNFDLPVNFNAPYQSLSIIEFWRRWHITLSRFLRDYVYIPLGGNRLGETRRYVNLTITMLLGGFWHGAGWTFILWGGAHGLMLSINHFWRKVTQSSGFSLPKPIAWTLTFLGIVFCWVVFRSHSLEQAIHLIQTMTGLSENSFDVLFPKRELIWIGMLVPPVLFLPESWQWVDFNTSIRTRNKLLLCSILLFISVVFISQQSTEFLYFQF